MKDKPISFSTPMVQAILEGRKTMTRRPKRLEHINEESNKWRIIRRLEKVKPLFGGGVQDFPGADDQSWIALMNPEGIEDYGYCIIKCPYNIGQRLWVKEVYSCLDDQSPYPHFVYRADGELENVKWHTPRFMPRFISRIDLEVTGIKAERVQDISEEDAQKEGVLSWEEGSAHGTCYDGFHELWDSIYLKKPDLQWNKNPWVWVIEFKRLI